MRYKKILLSSFIIFSSIANAASFIPVTKENYEVAESDVSFHNITKFVGSNKWLHFTGLTPLDNQTVVRMNRDTIYSGYIADLSKGGTVTVPDTGDRYISVMVVENDHYIDQVFTKSGTYQIHSQTDFAMIAVRIQIDPNDPSDMDNVKEFQRQLKVTTHSQKEHVLPNYDMKQLVALRQALMKKGSRLGSLKNMQGARGTIDPQMHLYGTALGWGLLPDTQAQYFSYYSSGEVANADNCSQATYEVPEVIGNGFYSITIYNHEGWIASEHSVLNKNNLEYNTDGTFTVHYGHCPKDAKNRMPVTDNWDLLFRIYQPDLEQTTSFKLPKPKIIN